MRHEYLTLEHLLLALLKDKRTGDVLEACGAHMGRMRQKLGKDLEENVGKLAERSKAQLRQTLGVERALNRAAIHALPQRRTTLLLVEFNADGRPDVAVLGPVHEVTVQLQRCLP
jgi:ATP-dependent Clp protease ATP-binding subunit ClpA